MKAPNENPKIEQLKYPCYVQPLPDLEHLEDVLLGHKAFYYYDKKHNKRYYYDCMPMTDYIAKKCKLTFEERLIKLRMILSELANYIEEIDLPTTKVTNPVELLDIYKDSLTNGFKGIRILNMDGYYIFGESTEGELWELMPRKVVVE